MPAARLQDHDSPAFFRLVERRMQGVEHRKRHHIGLAVVDHDGADRAGTGIGHEISHGRSPCRYMYPVDTLADTGSAQGISPDRKCMRASTGCICLGECLLALGKEASSSGLTGRSSIPETIVIHREAAAYWVPRFRGGRQMGRSESAPTTLSSSRP